MNSFWVWIYANVGLIKAGIILLIILIAIIFILRQYNIKSIVNKKAVRNNIENIKVMQNRDRNIIAANRFVRLMASVGKIKLFAYDDITREYMNYNLKRAGIMGPGGFRTLTADEFKGINVTGVIILSLLDIMLVSLISVKIALLTLIVILVLGSYLPKIVVRTIVTTKDGELKAGFPDFYLMLHYVLLTGGRAPLDKVMKSYARTTDNAEILNFISISVDYIETYGEYGAMSYIARNYRELPEIGKMCRIIKQMFEGADVENELVGFRSELIQQKKWEIEQKGDKLVSKAKMSFNILLIVLIQAVISAMLIYLPDLSSAGGLFGL